MLLPLGSRRQLGGMGQGGGGGGLALPYTFDPSAMSDGALPSPWTGAATWGISGGKIVNTPNEGSNIVTNGDMETGDPPTGWTPTNATIVADAAAYAGAQAAKVTSTSAAGFVAQNVGVTNHRWYGYRCKVKRTAGQIDFYLSFGTDTSSSAYHLTPAAYTEYRGAYWTKNTLLVANLRGFDNGTVAYWDNIEVFPLTLNELINSFDIGNAHCDIGASITVANYSPIGVIHNLDSQSDPKYFMMAYVDRTDAKLVKVLNGVGTQLIGTSVTKVAGANLEIRKTAVDTYQLWYNGSQVGTDQTVTDANLNNNTLVGILNTGGGSQAHNFFVTA